MSIAYVNSRNILQIHGFNLLKCPLKTDSDLLWGILCSIKNFDHNVECPSLS